MPPILNQPIQGFQQPIFPNTQMTWPGVLGGVQPQPQQPMNFGGFGSPVLGGAGITPQPINFGGVGVPMGFTAGTIVSYDARGNSIRAMRERRHGVDRAIPTDVSTRLFHD